MVLRHRSSCLAGDSRARRCVQPIVPLLAALARSGRLRVVVRSGGALIHGGARRADLLRQ